MPSNTLNSTRIVLIPGMAADASMFAAQAAELPGVVVADWIQPLRNESLASYAKRLSEQVNAPAGCLLGGASFGGIVALEMARYVNPSALVLIGSVGTPEELPRRIRILRVVATHTRWAPIRFCQRLAAVFNACWLRRNNAHIAAITRQFSGADPRLLRWSFEAILRWREAPRVECPVLRVHGDVDRVFPLHALASSPDRIVVGGGHVISLSHAKDVSDFLKACQTRIAQAEGRG